MLDEDEIGEDYPPLMSGDEDRPTAVEVFVQQRVIELLTVEEVEAQGGLVEDEEASRRWP